MSRKPQNIQKTFLLPEVESRLYKVPRLAEKDKKMFPLSPKVRDQSILPVLKWIIPLIYRRTGRLISRFQLAYYFVNRLILLKGFHGQT